MPRTIRFHLDENVNSAIAQALQRREVDVTTTPSQGLIGVPDEDQLAFALTQNRVIFTQDADFLKFNRAGVEHAGIVYCRQGSRSIGEIVRGLLLIWELLEPEEVRGSVQYI